MTGVADRTILAIDYGRARIGLAKTDPGGTIAGPVAALRVGSRRESIVKLLEVIADIRPAAVVIGYPLHWSGEPSVRCREIDRLIEELEKQYRGPIHRVDEYGTSAEAASVLHAHGKKSGRQKERLDRLAAVIILQRYLDEHRSQ